MSEGQYARRRISIRGPITGLILLAVVAYGAYWGWQAAFNSDSDVVSTGCPTSSATTALVSGTAATTTTPAAPTSTGPLVLQPADVLVNVYNATARPGLAANTASALRDRGFTIGETANDPLARAIPGIAEIRARTADLPAVLLLVQEVPGATVVADGRTDDSVDLVMGETFNGLGDPALVTPVLLPTPTSSC